MSNKKTYLRALEPSDYEIINKWHNDEKIFSRTMANKFFISTERDKEWVKKLIMDDSNFLFLAICLKETDEMIGNLSLTNIDLRNRKAYIGGINIDQKYQNQKLGFDAFDQFLDYAFLEMGLNKLNTGYLDSHKVTAYSLSRYGFVEELRLREEVYKLGKFHDVIVVSLLASEYKGHVGK